MEAVTPSSVGKVELGMESSQTDKFSDDLIVKDLMNSEQDLSLKQTRPINHQSMDEMELEEYVTNEESDLLEESDSAIDMFINEMENIGDDESGTSEQQSEILLHERSDEMVYEEKREGSNLLEESELDVKPVIDHAEIKIDRVVSEQQINPPTLQYSEGNKGVFEESRKILNIQSRDFSCDKCNSKFTGYKTLKRHKMVEHTVEPQICEICSEEFKNKFILAKHLKYIHDDRKEDFTCNICNDKMKSEESLKNHQKIQHTLEPQICEICSKEVKNKYLLAKHLRLKHPEANNKEGLNNEDVKFTCNVCNAQLKSIMHLNRHKTFEHTIDPQTCEVCKEEFPNQYKLDKHFKSEHDEGKVKEEPMFPCSICDRKFVSRKRLENHERLAHIYPDNSCEKCNRTFKTKEILVRHIKVIHDKNRIKLEELPCDICRKMFMNVKNFERHKIAAHETRMCEICSKVCNSKKVLYNHRRKVHTDFFVKIERSNNPKNEECNLCSDKFSSIKAMQNHFGRLHMKTVCLECNEQFNDKRKLRNHIKTEHVKMEEKGIEFKCEFCSKVFPSKKLHYNHVQYHHLGKSETCPICFLVFKTKGSLKIHIEDFHTEGPKNIHTCPECFKEFSKLRDLDNHKRSSHTEESHICHLCSSVLKNKYIFKQHMRNMHCEESRVNCEECGKEFKNKGSLSIHKRIVHARQEMVCGICSRTWKNEYRLKKHMANCMKRQRPLPISYVMGWNNDYPSQTFCKECDKHFVSTKTFRNHKMYTHKTGSVNCGLCFSKLKNLMLLRQHLRRQHKITDNIQVKQMSVVNVDCTKCEMKLSSENDLRLHDLQAHSAAGTLGCVMCGKKTKTIDNLRHHFKTIHKIDNKQEWREMIRLSVSAFGHSDPLYGSKQQGFGGAQQVKVEPPLMTGEYVNQFDVGDNVYSNIKSFPTNKVHIKFEEHSDSARDGCNQLDKSDNADPIDTKEVTSTRIELKDGSSSNDHIKLKSDNRVEDQMVQQHFKVPEDYYKVEGRGEIHLNSLNQMIHTQAEHNYLAKSSLNKKLNMGNLAQPNNFNQSGNNLQAQENANLYENARNRETIENTEVSNSQSYQVNYLNLDQPHDLSRGNYNNTIHGQNLTTAVNQGVLMDGVANNYVWKTPV